MLELRLRNSELQTFENRSQNIYTQSLKKQIQRIITLSFTTNFSNFSSFKILHRLFKYFVIPTPNRVFGSSKSHFLKSDLKYLKYLKSDRLQTKQTIIYIRKLQSVPNDKIILRKGGVSSSDVYNSPLQEQISLLIQNTANRKIKQPSKYMIYRICSNILSKWIEKIFYIHTFLSQWIRGKAKDTKFIIFANSCNLKKVAVNPVYY